MGDERVKGVGYALALVVLLLHVAAAHINAQPASPPTVHDVESARITADVHALAERLATLETANLPTDVAVLKSQVGEMLNLVRGLAGAAVVIALNAIWRALARSGGRDLSGDHT